MKHLQSQRSRRRRQQRRGATTVEFTFVALGMFFIIFACIEYGRLTLMRSMAQDAAYIAARHAMVDGSTEQEAIDKAEAILSWVGVRNADIEINDNNFTGDGKTSIEVDITIPMEDNSFMLSRFTHEKEMQAEITLAAETLHRLFRPDVDRRQRR